ncbi:MAG: 50S ribosomal protein L11 methyltransferase [Deltaproteobacteria bacterium]|jgi:ribosomal protein L11 methylase PrmA
MTGREDHPWVEVVVKVPHDMEGSVSGALSSFIPLMMWEQQKKQSDTCLLKTTVVMDGHVDGILADIDAALRQAEAKHGLLEPMSVELQVFDADEPGGRPRQRQPRRVSSHLALGLPSHHLYGGSDHMLLLIEPQEAFGDGNHPSTRVALRLVDELLSGQHGPPPEANRWGLDAGCGTGVLALAAAALGGFKVLAVDVDPRAVRAAGGNLKLNPEPGCKVFLALGELSCARGPFCLVMANLVPTLHVRVYETLWQGLAPGGWLILSGFCQTHKDSILRPYIHHGAAEKACSVDQAWVGTLLYKQE